MSNLDLKELSEALPQGLTFTGESLKWSTAEDVKEVVDAINKAETLTFLKLSGNTLGIDAAEAIGNALKNHPEFKEALWTDMFTGRLKNEIPVALRHLSNGLIEASAQLTVFECSDNALGPNGMEGLNDLLRSRVCYSLKELRLNNCGLGIGGGRMLADSIISCYKTSQAAGTPLKLNVLVVGRNRLEDDGATSIAEMLSTLKTLEEVSIPQNSIFVRGITALANALKQNPNLKHLNFNDNIMKSGGASAMADAIKNLSYLRYLNLGDCLLSTEGASAIADALLDGHEELEEVYLDCNEIGFKGCEAVVTSLANKPKLHMLNIDGNCCGAAGIAKIIHMMAVATNPGALAPFTDDHEEGDDEGEVGDDGDADYNDVSKGEEDDESGSVEDYSGRDDCEDDDQYLEESGGEDEQYLTTLCNQDQEQDGSLEESFQSSKNVTSPVLTVSTAVEEFCDEKNPPSLNMFLKIVDSDKVQSFRNYLNLYKAEDKLYMLVYTALYCASLSKQSDDALKVSMALFEDAYKFGKQTKTVPQINEFFLIQFGLKKAADETFTPLCNTESCQYAFKKALQEPEIPDDVKEEFSVYFEKSQK